MIPHDHETEHDRVTYWRGSKDESRREKTSVIFVISVKYSINRWDLLLLGQMVGSKAKAPTSVPESFPARYSPHPSFSTSPSSGENPSSTLSSGFMPYVIAYASTFREPLAINKPKKKAREASLNRGQESGWSQRGRPGRWAYGMVRK